MKLRFTPPVHRIAVSPCRICGSLNSKSFDNDGAIYNRCSICDALQKNISKAEYEAMHVTYDPGPSVEGMDIEELKRRLSFKNAIKDLQAAFRRTGAGSTSGRLLEIGCGSGRFLLAGQALGMECVGIEPSAEHAAAGQKILGLDIRIGYFTPGSFAGEKFDVIVLSHVIEHIFDPRSFLEAAYALLNPGGFILIFTPNASNPIARLLGRNWVMLAPPDHVSMLGPRAAKALTPKGADCIVRSSEYHWEPAVTVLVALRTAMRRRSGNSTASPTKSGQPLSGAFPLNAPLRAVLSVISLPLRLYGTMTGTAICLVVTYRRPFASLPS